MSVLFTSLSQRRYTPYSFPLSLRFAPLASHPPLIFFSHSPTPTLLLLHFLLPSTTAYNGATRVNSIAAVASARLRRDAQLLRTTFRRDCKSAVRGILRGRWRAGGGWEDCWNPGMGYARAEGGKRGGMRGKEGRGRRRSRAHPVPGALRVGEKFNPPVKGDDALFRAVQPRR